MTPRVGVGCRLVDLVLTDACNLRCEYCCVPGKLRGRVPWPMVRSSLDALLRTAADNIEVTFTGGEPLLAFATLRRAVVHVEQKIGARRVQWRVLTNGLLLDDEVLTFLDAHRFLVNLSFDGVPAAQALRGRTTYRRLDNLLEVLRERYRGIFCERLKVCLTLSPATIPHLAASVGYFIEKGVKTFTISPVIGAVEWQPRRIEDLERQFENVSAQALHHYERTGEVPLLLFRKSASAIDAERSEWICRVAEGQSVTIDVDGNAYACLPATTTYQRDPAPVMRPAVEALRLGPAYAPGFEERLTAMGAAARAAGAFQHPERRYSSYRTCADCEFLGRCRICPLACASVPGWDDMHRVSDFVCAFNQVALAHRDRFPCQPTADDFLSGQVPLSALERPA